MKIKMTAYTAMSQTKWTTANGGVMGYTRPTREPAAPAKASTGSSVTVSGRAPSFGGSTAVANMGAKVAVPAQNMVDNGCNLKALKAGCQSAPELDKCLNGNSAADGCDFSGMAQMMMVYGMLMGMLMGAQSGNFLSNMVDAGLPYATPDMGGPIGGCNGGGYANQGLADYGWNSYNNAACPYGPDFGDYQGSCAGASMSVSFHSFWG
jgi:hypothetical protein